MVDKKYFCKKDLIKNLLGRKIASFNSFLQILRIGFGDVSIRTEEPFTVSLNEKILLGDMDCYIKNKYNEYEIENTLLNTIFHDFIKKHKDLFLDKKVKEVLFDNHDLVIKLENDIKIKLFVDTDEVTSFYEKKEDDYNYRIYKRKILKD
ncbi:MAG: hypothetical protein ACOX02_00935 [Acholeplasmatales bacterium]